MSNQCVRLFVTGRVQGVFFRQSFKAKSIQNNMTSTTSLPSLVILIPLVNTDAIIARMVTDLK